MIHRSWIGISARKVEVNAMMTMMTMMFLVGASEAVDEGIIMQVSTASSLS